MRQSQIQDIVESVILCSIVEGGVKELANYRLERAKEMLQASKDNLGMKQYRTSLNRSYYAVFHAMRA